MQIPYLNQIKFQTIFNEYLDSIPDYKKNVALSFSYSFLAGTALSGGNPSIGFIAGISAAKACYIYAICLPLFKNLTLSTSKMNWLESALTDSIVLTGAAFLSRSLGYSHLLENLSVNILIHSCFTPLRSDFSSKIFVVLS